MSYTALFEFILEDDISYIIKYETKGTNLSVGDVFDAWFLDFEYNNKTYYPIYAINCGEIYYRTRTEGRNGVFCKSMIISEKEEFERWYIFCTDNESESIGDQKVNIQDFIEEIFISDKSGTYTTKGSEDMISIDITTGAMSDSFASYGSTVSPSMSFTMFSCDFTDAIISGAIKSDVIEGSVVYVYYRLIGHVDAVPFGQFVIKEKPHITEETVSFNAVGIMEAYMDIAEIDIKALNLYHYNELEEKYVRNNKNKNYHMDFIRYDSDLYFWEFLPQDFLRVTGCPLYIEDWSEVLSDITEYNLMHLMIPAVESVEKKEESWMIESIEYASRITWRELLSGIAVLLRGNVIEKNGAFYIKKMPKTPVDIFYRQVFDNDFYDNSSSFGYDLSCPSNISVKANNWWFYEQKRDPVAFGYYNGESTVVINDKKSEYSNASYYPVTIECPWILFETIDRQEKRTPFDMSSWLGFSKTGQVMKWSKLGEQRNTAFVYSQATVNMIGWHPAFSAGEMVVVEDYEGMKKYVYIGEMTLRYDGGISCEINSRCDVEGNAVSSGSGGSSSSYSSGTVANSSGGNMSLQLGVTIKDGVIDGSKITDSTITGSKIEDSTITGSLIDDSTITNSHIVDGTLDGSTKIANATIDFEKVDTSFIDNLTADDAYVKNFKADVADIDFLTADDAIIKNIQATAISADYIKATTAELGYMTADEADIKYANITFGNIDTANIDTGNIGLLFNEVGLIDRATIVDGHITGFLDAVEVNANQITAGTLIADRLLLKGSENGLLYAINNLGELSSQNTNTLDGYILTERTVTADRLVAKSITANEIDADKIFTDDLIAQTIAANSGEFLELSASQIKTGTLSADRIGTNSITSNKIAIGNFNNLSVVDPDIDYKFGGKITIIDGIKYLQFGSASSAGWYQLDFNHFPQNTKFSVGDSYKLRAKGYGTATSVVFVLRVSYTDGTYADLGTGKASIPSINGDISAQLSITNSINDNKTVELLRFFFMTRDVKGLVYIRDITIYQMGSGELIVDGAITADKIDINNVFANNAVIEKIFAQDITATGTITGATLKGGEIEGAKIVAKNGTIGGFNITDKKIEKITSLSQVEESATMLSTESIFGSDGNNEKEGACLHSYNKDLGTGTIKTGQWIEIVNGELLAGVYDITQSNHSAELVINGQQGIVANKISADNLDCQKATTSIYGITKLSSSLSSTSTALAATPYAVKQVNDKFTFSKISKTGTGTVSTTAAFSNTKEILVQLTESVTGNYYTFTWNVNPSNIGGGNGLMLISGYQWGSVYGFARVRLGRTTAEIVNCIIGGTEYASNSTLDISYR